jgi:hypothetical protein
MKTILVVGGVAVAVYVLFFRSAAATALGAGNAAAAGTPRPGSTALAGLLPQAQAAAVGNLQSYCRQQALADPAAFRANRPAACIGVTV